MHENPRSLNTELFSMDALTFSCFEEFVTEVTDFSENFSKMQFSDGLPYELKEDNTPVTDIDLLIETFLRNSIEQRFPDHSMPEKSSQIKFVTML